MHYFKNLVRHIRIFSIDFINCNRIAQANIVSECKVSEVKEQKNLS